MACGTITMGSAADCDNLPAGGTKARAIVFNQDDIDEIIEDDDGRIIDINMKAGKYGYEFLGFRQDMKALVDIIKPDVGPSQFKHTTGLVIYDRTQEQKNNAEKFARGKFLVVIELKGKDGDEDRLILIGHEQGVEIVAGTIWDAHSNGGFFVLSFATADDQGEFESKMPQTVGATYAAGLALINALLPAS